MDRSVVTVFGGNGFIGRALVRQLVSDGHRVRVASRSPRKAAPLVASAPPETIMPVYASVTDGVSVRAALSGASAAINLVSILTEKGDATFQQLNAEAPGMVARLAREENVGQFVQVSAIGAAQDAPSVYGRSKAEGERRVHDAFPDATILRPSVVFGPGDSFLTLFGLMARALPLLPVYYPGTFLQPVYVEDVARAARLCLVGEGESSARGRSGIYELGGPDRLTMAEIMAFVAKAVGRTPRLLSVPNGLAQIQAHVLENLPGKLLTRDQLAMLSQDNIVKAGASTLETLGVVPQSVYDRAPEYLSQIRVLRTLLN
ncbi:complex I NDUFA9 subunit family protein [Asaia astilbis]|uniref:complex I NDUFA9 subunit family protein n=1 Tax=Asaia astilbis TaxID=610244 RepID=UPI00046EE526|nr:complex I NDUFA9 subunit family protein [Asaia astilbis]